MSDIINFRDKQLEKLCEGKEPDFVRIARSYWAALNAVKEIALLTAKKNEEVNIILTRLNKELDDYAKMPRMR